VDSEFWALSAFQMFTLLLNFQARWGKTKNWPEKAKNKHLMANKIIHVYECNDKYIEHHSVLRKFCAFATLWFPFLFIEIIQLMNFCYSTYISTYILQLYLFSNFDCSRGGHNSTNTQAGDNPMVKASVRWAIKMSWHAWPCLRWYKQCFSLINKFDALNSCM
jgi:hypothetical protein